MRTKQPAPAQPAATQPKKRDVVITGQFKRDFTREQKGKHGRTVRDDLKDTVDMLADDIPLPAQMVDHPLGGNWKDHRDCHLKPDLVLIYRKVAAGQSQAAEAARETDAASRQARIA